MSAYWTGLDELVGRLEGEVGGGVSRSCSLARLQPALLVTALRIIEREEAADSDWAAQGFQPPGRPRGWRSSALARLRSGIAERAEGVACGGQEEKFRFA